MKKMLKSTLYTLLSLMLLSTLTHCASGDDKKAKEETSDLSIEADDLVDDKKISLTIKNNSKQEVDLGEYTLTVKSDEEKNSIIYEGAPKQEFVVKFSDLIGAGNCTLAAGAATAAIEKFTIAPDTAAKAAKIQLVITSSTGDTVATKDITWTRKEQDSPPPDGKPKLTIAASDYDKANTGTDLALTIVNTGNGPAELKDYTLKVVAEGSATVKCTAANNTLETLSGDATVAANASVTISSKFTLKPGTDKSIDITYTLTTAGTEVDKKTVKWEDSTIIPPPPATPAVEITKVAYKEVVAGTQELHITIKNTSSAPIKFVDYANLTRVKINSEKIFTVNTDKKQVLAPNTEITIKLTRKNAPSIVTDGSVKYTFTFTLKKKGVTGNKGQLTAKKTYEQGTNVPTA